MNGIFPISLCLQDNMDHLSAAVYPQFLIDFVDMVLDCIIRNEQKVFDLFIAFSLQNELHYLSFPLGYLFILCNNFQEFNAVF